MSKLRAQGKHTVLYLGIGYLIMFVGGILIAKVLGPTDRGALGLAQQTYFYLLTIGMVGISAANVYYSARRPADRPSLRRNSGIHGTFVGIGFGILLIVISRALQSSIFIEVPKDIWAPFAIMLPIAMFFNFWLGMERGLGDIQEANKHNLGLMILQIVVALVALWQTSQVVPVAWGYWLGLVFASIWMFSSVGQKVPVGRIDFSLYLAQLRYGIPYTAYVLLSSLAARFDLFLVAGMGNLTEAGKYAVALTLAEVLWKFPGAIGYAIFPALAGNPDEESPRVARLSRMITTATLGISLLWILPAFGICQVLGTRYDGTFLAFALLIPGTWAAGILETLSAAQSAKGWPMSLLLPHGIFAAVMAGLDVWLIPRYGIMGAAIGSSVGAWCGALVILVNMAGRSGIPYAEYIFSAPGEILAAWNERPQAQDEAIVQSPVKPRGRK